MDEINYTLLQVLQGRPHPALNEGFLTDLQRSHQAALAVRRRGLAALLGNSIEMAVGVKVAHHLLTLAGVPDAVGPRGDNMDLEARTWVAIRQLSDTQERLCRIAYWHERETGPAGMVGDHCIECEHPWPCDTRRMAEGYYEE